MRKKKKWKRHNVKLMFVLARLLLFSFAAYAIHVECRAEEQRDCFSKALCTFLNGGSMFVTHRTM